LDQRRKNGRAPPRTRPPFALPAAKPQATKVKPRATASPAQRPKLPVAVAVITVDDDTEIRVQLVERAGRVEVDVRRFERFTAAKAFMGTGRAVSIPVDQADAVAAAISAAFDQGLV